MYKIALANDNLAVIITVYRTALLVDCVFAMIIAAHRFSFLRSDLLTAC